LLGTARRELGAFDGELIAPQDSGYDEARKVYSAMIDKHPGAGIPDTGRRLRIRRDRSYRSVTEALDRPTSLEFIHDTPSSSPARAR
jgi:hypothetical protein